MSERLYALLLRLYPSHFRERFGADMSDLFSDQLRSARHARGRTGVAALWLRVLPSLLKTAALEHGEAFARCVGSTIPNTAGPGRRHTMLDVVRMEVRVGWRMLWRSPVFAAVAVLVIALGSGGVTTIYSAMNALFLRPLPGTTSPDRLVELDRTLVNGDGSLSASYVYVQAVREGARSLAGVAAWANVRLSVSAEAAATAGNAAVAHGAIVTGNYFDVLGVRPALGRFFVPEEDRTELTHPVIVIAHGFWQDRFGADGSVVGRTVSVNGRPYTVIGVAPPEFRGVFTPLRTDAWLPLMMQPHLRPGRDLADPSAAWLRVFGRLADGATIDAARAELTSLTATHAAGAGEAEEFRAFAGVEVRPMTGLPADARSAATGFMALLFAAAVLVLLIASVNVAGMLAARAIGRRREMAVRAALGAGRAQLIRQLLTETLLLFVLGALGGFALAHVATAALERVPLPGDANVFLDLAPDARVFVFSIAMALVTGVVSGLAPALQTARRDITSRLRDGSQSAGERRTLLNSGLVVGQLALALVLLVAAGLFLRALDRGRDIDPGFELAGVATTSLNTTSWGYDAARSREFFRLLRERVESLPGVTAVSTAAFLPLAFGTSSGSIEVDGVEVNVDMNRVDHGYFDVLRLPIVAGRAFNATDVDGAPRVAVINETLARRHWPDGNAVGSTFVDGEVVRIVGIARDAKYSNLSESTPRYVYFPVAQRWIGTQILMMRTTADPAAYAAAIRDAVRTMDPALPPVSVSTLEREAGVVLLPQRVAAAVTGAFGALGLLLAAVGLYGVMAYSVGRRSREIGIRMALGAHRADVLRMMVRQGLRLAGTGVVIGLLLAAGATRFMASLLFGLSPFDGITFIAMSLLFLAVAGFASWVPARRAAAADPMTVLRAE